MNTTWDACTACGNQVDDPQPLAVLPESHLAPDANAPAVDEPVVDEPVVDEPAVDDAPEIHSAPEIGHAPEIASAPVFDNHSEGFAIKWSSNTAAEQTPAPPVDWSQGPPLVAAAAAAAAQTESSSFSESNQTFAAPGQTIDSHDDDPQSIGEQSAAAPFALPSFMQNSSAQSGQPAAYAMPFDGMHMANARPSRAIGAPVIIAIVVGCIVLIPIILIGAVSFIGASASQKFESVGTPISPEAETTATTATRDWVAFSDPDGHFTVSLPTTPSTNKQGSRSIYSAPNADSSEVAIVSTNPVPSNMQSQTAKQLLTFSVNSLASSTNMQIKGQTTGTDGSAQYLDALLANDTSSTNVRFVLHNNVIYQLQITTNNTTNNALAFSKLTKSFVYVS